jgi:hypothetical protein
VQQPGGDMHSGAPGPGAPSASVGIAIPQSYKEAMNGPDRVKWDEANQREINALWTDNTFEWVQREPGMKVIDTKYVYRIKTDEHGRITQWKARIVARGDQQRWVRLNGSDDDTDPDSYYSPTAQIEVIRAVLQIAQLRKMKVNLADVRNAYLKAKLVKRVYLRVPHGFTVPEGLDPATTVLRLNKSIYGLRESALLWNEELDGWLTGLGFKRLQIDPCVYRHPKTGAIVGVHVDDLIIATHTDDDYDDIIKALRKKTDLVETRNPRKVLGMEVRIDNHKGETVISSKQRIIDLAAHYNLTGARPVSTPLDPGEQLHVATPDEVKNARQFPYREIVGSLSYIAATTRPDVSQAVSLLSRYSNAWATRHWNAAKRVVRYLYGTADRGLTFRRDVVRRIVAYADASHTSGDSSRSTSGYMVGMATEDGMFTPLLWKSKLQNFTAQSTAEAEVESIAACIVQTDVIEHVFAGLNVRLKAHPLVLTDAKAAQSIRVVLFSDTDR